MGTAGGIVRGTSKRNRHQVKMRILPMIAGFALATATAVRPALPAESYDLGYYGVWTAYRAVSSDGTALCGIRETGSNGRSFHLKWYAGSARLVAQIFKAGWSIPSGTTIPMAVQFDSFTPWKVDASGVENMVQFGVPLASLRQFAQEFRAANRIQIYFLAGTEGSWNGNLAGSGAAMDALIRCMDTLPGANGSQPFDPSPPATSSQPFSPQPFSPQPQQPAPPPQMPARAQQL
ncbi:MAG: hypothetical protein J0H99_09375 [Rhodospirillales bacterium]|nr:hypothetical protein [Rhodospirillales bacterium]